MDRVILLVALATTAFASPSAAQLQPPQPAPAAAPRASWSLTSGVTGTPSQRRDNPGAASQDKLYVFGGRASNAATNVYNALYEFDGAAWTLKTAEGAPGSPPARGGACVAWDHGRDRLVVFGGDTGGSAPALLGDTWEWDPKANAWTQILGAGPTPRRWAAMAFDPVTTGMLLFGGETQLNGAPTAETWLLLNGVWTNRTTPTAPPARRQHSLVTRPDFRDVFLCSGQDASLSPQVRYLDAWRWVGAWLPITTGGTHPHGTTANQAVYDEARKRVVLQGGQGISVPNTAGGGQYGDLYGGSPSTWCSEFDCLTDRWILFGASNWNTADPVIGRISRYFAGYVPALGKVYKVSGQNPSGTGTITATCEYQAKPLATSSVLGSGCQNRMLAGAVPYERPWLGRDLRTTASGLGNGSIALGIVGFQSLNLSLQQLFPFAGSGCTLHCGLDLVLPLPVVAGEAALQLPLPNDARLAGVRFYEQVLELQVGGASFTGLFATNGLVLVTGAL